MGGSPSGCSGYLGFPKYGVKGAAIAIAVSECMGAVFLFAWSLWKRLIMITKDLDIKYTIMTYKIGYPIFIDRLLQNAGSMVFAKVILLYGTAVYAAHQVGLGGHDQTGLPPAMVTLKPDLVCGQ